MDMTQNNLSSHATIFGDSLEIQQRQISSHVSDVSQNNSVEIPALSTNPMSLFPTVRVKAPQASIVRISLETTRSVNERKRLKTWATQRLLGRDDVELEELEITGGSTRYHPVVCGVIVDATSAEGMVVVAARGYPVRQVVTGKTIAGDCSVEMAIQEGEVCHIYGGSTVLFYKPFIKACTRTAEPELTVHRKSTKGPPTLQLPSLQLPPLESPGVLLPSFRDLINGVPPSSPPGVPVITVRLQKDSEGRFGKSHDMSCFQARTKAVEFFAWFGRQTGRGGAQGPPVLFVSLPNAIPHAKSVKVVRDIEEDFKYARRRILVHYEKTKLLSTSLREFAVLITEPGWGSK